jgi:sulfur carrier protein ThiS
MRIRVKPAGIIRRYVEQKDMEVPADLTIRGLIAILAIPAELKLMVFVNGQRTDPDEIIEDGNEVRLITLLSGG